MVLRISLKCKNCNYNFSTFYNTELDCIEINSCPTCNNKIDKNANELLRNAMDRLCSDTARYPCKVLNIEFFADKH